MKVIRIIVICALMISLLVLSVPAFAAEGRDNSGRAPEINNGPGAENTNSDSKDEMATGRILVKFKDGVTKAAEDAINHRNGGKVLSENTDIGVQLVQVDSGKVNNEVKAYLNDQDVEFAEPDYVATVVGEPTDPYLSQEWGITDIQAPPVWNLSIAGNPDIKIAVLDTGIDQDHPDLMGQIVANVNFSTSTTVDDLFGHGTHVAGIIGAANNGIGVVGVAYNCSLMNVKVMDDDGSGYYSAIANGITWAVDNGAKVINMSLGGTSSSKTLSNAVNYAWQKGVVVVAAAGNDNNSTPFYPAAYKNVISVAAVGQDDTKAYFSNYGRWVAVAAPGIAILSTLPDDPCVVSSQLNYGLLSGTSMATPFVSGLAGILWDTPAGTGNSNVVNCIEKSADDIAGTGSFWKYGRIDALNAVSLASQSNTNGSHGRGK